MSEMFPHWLYIPLTEQMKKKPTNLKRIYIVSFAVTFGLI